MKNKLGVLVCVFCAVVFAVSVADARPKPDNPAGKPGGGKDKTRAECIVFVNNKSDPDDDHVWLEGGQDCAIEGCCPNAGPFPQYRMTLHNVCYESPYEGLICLQMNAPFLGRLFMNGFGRNAPYEGWLVQFWTCDYRSGERPHYGDFFFQVRGGTGGDDKKTKVTVVDFLNEGDATLWVYYDEDPDCYWFEDDTCEPCLNNVQAACDPRNDPDCQYPCWIEQPLDNVSFVIVRTADLSYSSTDLGITCPDITCDFP